MKRIDEIEVLKIYYMRAVMYREELEATETADATQVQIADSNVQERAKELRRVLRKHEMDQSILVWDMPSEYVKMADAL